MHVKSAFIFLKDYFDRATMPQSDPVWLTRNRAHVLLAVVMIMAIGLFGVPGILNAPSLWLDEAASLAFSRMPLDRLWGDWMVLENNPPLFYTLLKFWITLWGDSLLSLRLFAIGIAFSCIPLIYKLGAELGQRLTGLIAAFLFAVSPLYISHAIQLRAYSLSAFGTLLALFGMARILNAMAKGERLRPAPLTGYLLGAGIAAYGHSTMIVFPFLCCVVFFIFFMALLPKNPPALWPSFWSFTGINAVLLLIWSWWGFIIIRQMQLAIPYTCWLPKPHISDIFLALKIATWPGLMDDLASTYVTDYLLLSFLCFSTVALFISLRLKKKSGAKMAPPFLGVALLFCLEIFAHLSSKIMIGLFFVVRGMLASIKIRPLVWLLFVCGIGGPAILYGISQFFHALVPRTALWAGLCIILLMAHGIAQSRSVWFGLFACIFILFNMGPVIDPQKYYGQQWIKENYAEIIPSMQKEYCNAYDCKKIPVIFSFRQTLLSFADACTRQKCPFTNLVYVRNPDPLGDALTLWAKDIMPREIGADELKNLNQPFIYFRGRPDWLMEPYANVNSLEKNRFEKGGLLQFSLWIPRTSQSPATQTPTLPFRFCATDCRCDCNCPQINTNLQR